MSCPALATAGPCLLARLVNDSSGSRGKPLVGDASRCRTRSSFDPPSQRGVRRGVQRTRGKTVLHASQDAWSGRSSEHDEDAARARDAAAASGRVAPLDVKTLVGAELELIMKADPLAFDKALADQVRPSPRGRVGKQKNPKRETFSANLAFLLTPVLTNSRRTTLLSHPNPTTTAPSPRV